TLPPLLRTTLFPYTTLFRSGERRSWISPSGTAYCCSAAHRSAPDTLLLPVAHIPADDWSGSSVGPHGLSAFQNISNAFSGKIRRSEEHTSELQSRFDLVCRL